jgi:hypothetical protein|tara:strand:- start:353 stop:1414 length:1062 start_codon:yes stop_codon:yes gene_type:complete
MALVDSLNFEIHIDKEPFPFVSQMSMTAKVNSARTVTCMCSSLDGLEKVRIGAEVTIKFGRGNTITNKDFTGIIKLINPKLDKFGFVAYDLVSHLANSEVFNFKEGDYSNQDLYMSVADAADYKGISIAKMTKGSGINADSTMDIYGLQTRKAFIDNCMTFMVDRVLDIDHPKLSFLPYYYAIREGTELELFQPDHLHRHAKGDMVVSLDSANIANDGLVSSYTSVGMVNSCTVISKDDDTLINTYNDEGSIERYGVMSKVLTYDTDRKDILEKIGRLIVEQFNKPSIAYRISLLGAEWLTLGSLLELRSPALKTNEVLPVVSYNISIQDKIETVIEVGTPSLSTDTLIRDFF